MKRKAILTVATLLFSVTALLAQTADDIVAKYMEARGGADKLKGLQSLILEGTMTQQGVDVTMKFTHVQGKAMRVEFTAMGQTGYNIITNTEGWVMNPFGGGGGAEALPEEQVKAGQGQLDIQGPLVDYKTKGNTVEYLGKVSEQGAEFHKLKLTRQGGNVTFYYLDDKYLLVKAVTSMKVQGNDTEIITEYSDYRKTPDGLVFAYKRNNNGNEISFEKVEVNPKIDEAVFKPGN